MVWKRWRLLNMAIFGIYVKCLGCILIYAFLNHPYLEKIPFFWLVLFSRDHEIGFFATGWLQGLHLSSLIEHPNEWSWNSQITCLSANFTLRSWTNYCGKRRTDFMLKSGVTDSAPTQRINFMTCMTEGNWVPRSQAISSKHSPLRAWSYAHQDFRFRALFWYC